MLRCSLGNSDRVRMQSSSTASCDSQEGMLHAMAVHRGRTGQDRGAVPQACVQALVLVWASRPAPTTPRGWAGAAQEEQVTYRAVRVHKNTITIREPEPEPELREEGAAAAAAAEVAADEEEEPAEP